MTDTFDPKQEIEEMKDKLSQVEQKNLILEMQLRVLAEIVLSNFEIAYDHENEEEQSDEFTPEMTADNSKEDMGLFFTPDFDKPYDIKMEDDQAPAEKHSFTNKI